MRRVSKRVFGRRQTFPGYAAVVLTACGAFATGCGNDDNNNGSDGGVGATGGRTTAGGAAATGGKASGGAGTAAGGLVSTGGTTAVVAAGGQTASGGNTSTSTTLVTTGGSTVVGTATTGGSTNTGGAGTVVNSGGSTSTATAAVGGVMSVGGASATGGVTSSTGGMQSVGGATATGGTSAVQGGGSGVGGSAMDATVGPLRSLDIDLSGMTTDVNHLMVFRVVNSTDELVSIGILDPLPTASYTFTLPMSVPEGMHRVEFFADLSGDRVYTPMSTDEGWSRPIPPAPSPTVNFAYNTNYTDFSTSPVVPIGEDFTFHATGMTPHVGQSFELRVIVADTGQVVGLYHLHAVPAATFDLVIPGIIANSVPYRVDFWADVNGNNEYNSPPVDHAWRMTGEGTAAGLTLSFAHNTDFTDVAF